MLLRRSAGAAADPRQDYLRWGNLSILQETPQPVNSFAARSRHVLGGFLPWRIPSRSRAAGIWTTKKLLGKTSSNSSDRRAGSRSVRSNIWAGQNTVKLLGSHLRRRVLQSAAKTRAERPDPPQTFPQIIRRPRRNCSPASRTTASAKARHLSSSRRAGRGNIASARVRPATDR